jgi:uncharacterized glyoxalase superfamily protein PhnB
MLAAGAADPDHARRCCVFKLAIPVLHVAGSSAAEAFYCGQLGFRREFEYRPVPDSADPCYMGVSRDGAWLHLSSFAGDGVPGGCVYLLVEDLDAVHDELIRNSVSIDMEPTLQTWGNREMYVRDIDGNSVRFVQS